jgi:hypothetical protein
MTISPFLGNELYGFTGCMSINYRPMGFIIFMVLGLMLLGVAAPSEAAATGAAATGRA